MVGLKKASSTTVLLVTLVLVSCIIESAYSAGAALILAGKVRDQAPDTMAHAKFPRNYWVYNGWTDNPTSGSCGTKANGGAGFQNTDFELPLYRYGTIRNASSNSGGVLYNGEPGLVGPCCNKSNSWTNCATLADDKTPKYAYTANSPYWTIQSPASFNTWFHDSPQTATVPYNLTLPSIGGRLYGIDGEFFPVDNQGWADYNIGGSTNVNHNFAFCFEIHGHFSYQGGEIFKFKGDDDLWVYLDSRLVIDLGGIHTALSAQVDVDDMGLTLGTNYRFDFFYCERHTTASDLQLTTSIEIACTYYDWCDICEGNGQSCCTAADIASCNDNNACTADSCAVLVPPKTGCQNIDITPACPGNKCYTAGCDKNKGCTQTPVVCNDNKVCTTDTCNNATGCVFTPIALTCGDACNTPSCSESAGGCVTTPVSCDDHNACTNDKCDRVNGCQYTNVVCPTDACVSAVCDSVLKCVNTTKSCNDNDPCTADSCDPVSGCSNVAIPCGDNNQCKIWSCNPTQLCHYVNKSCDDNDPCTLDSCNPTTGCSHIPNTCDDSDACTIDSCVSSLPGGCKHVPRTCEDNNVCTNNTCDKNSGCLFPIIPCVDNDACTNDTCDPIGGCKHLPIVCDDHSACTNNTCDSSIGCQFPPISCADNSPCTIDTCNPSDGCHHDQTTQNCDRCQFTNGTYITCPPENGDLCRPVECDPGSGACNVTIPKVCNDNSLCTDDSCVSATGECSFVQVSCDDHDLCTDDSCTAATGCIHTNKSCDDHNPCTADSCNAGTCSNIPIPGNCLACAGLPCTWTDSCNPKSCVNNQCVPQPVNCDDNNPCSIDSCDNSTATAQCTHVSKACNNADLCNPQQCNVSTGICDVIPKNCDDNNPCTADTCSVVAGVPTCGNVVKVCTASTPCNPQSCNSDTGNCEATNAVDCDDHNACTVDSCVNTLSGHANCTYDLVDCSDYDTGDLCTPAVCNASVGCVPSVSICNDGNICTEDACIGPMNCSFTDGNYCDDNDACTDDVCNGNEPTLAQACSHTNHTCVASSICANITGCNATTGCIESPKTCNASLDYCLVPKCDEVAGCIDIPRVCIVDDPDCYVGSCDSVNQQCITSPLPDWTTITTKKGNGVTCYAFYNKGATAGIITGGVVAGIVVGAVVFAAVAAAAGRKAYLYMQLKQGNMGAAQANPLYVAGTAGGENPLFGGG